MKISVFGLGYVGSVTAACFAQCGHQVIGIDVEKKKNNAIDQGKSPVYEPDLSELIREVVSIGNLSVTNSVNTAVQETEISFICIGTPINSDESLDLHDIQELCREIGKILKIIDHYHIVVIRSTVFPGNTENSFIPLLEEYSQKRAGSDFGVAVNPEFFREGQAINDFFSPERTVIGSNDNKSGEIVKQLYKSSKIIAPIVQSEIRVAEMIKYVDNTFHAIKVTFANEIGSICLETGIDSQQIMDIFLMDRKLNLSPYYFTPGFAFGGSCLQKDVMVLQNRAKELRLNCPLINSVIASNEEHINRIVNLIIQQNRKRIGIFGLTFKNNTNDIRNSPAITLINRLLDKGYNRLIDKDFSIQIYDSNYDQIDVENLPTNIHILINQSLNKTVFDSEILVITISDQNFRHIPALMRSDQVLIDLVHLIDEEEIIQGKYLRIC
jgi:GDP-mannose 6-dehydrogenase